jgi:sugar/nucleoside kinase (ribokinase family)
VDTIVYVPELPLPLRDSYPVPAITARAGHTGDGVAIGLHALGLRTHHLDIIGDDHEGDLVRALHRDHDVSFTPVPGAGGTKRAVNLVDPAGRRLSLYDVSRGDDRDSFPPDLVAALAAASRHTHVSITHPARDALGVLATHAATISTDLHDWDGTNPYHETFALAADIVFLSTAGLGAHEDAMRHIIAAGRARAVVATAGADGSFLLTRGHERVRHFPAVTPTAPVVDSNGAGDAFVAGFLYGHLHDAPVEVCMRYGAIAGGHACTVPSTGVQPIDAATLTARAGITDGAP